MRITHVIKTNGIAGAEAHLLILLPALRERGFDIRVLFIAPVNGEGEDFASALESAGVPVERVPIRRHGSPGLMWTLSRVLRRQKPDIAHIHLYHAELWGIPAARLARVPAVIASRHNDDPRRSRFPLSLIYRGLWRLTDIGICISESVRRMVLAEGAPPDRLRLIPYGLPARPPVDKAAARASLRQSLGLPPDALLFGAVCRLLDWKGVQDAIAAFARISVRQPEAHLIIAGDGPYRAALETLAAALGVAPHVHFLGWQPQTAAIFAGLDVFLAPSHREGFGIVTLEAMNESTPVIASRAGALPEIIVDGETGLLVPPKSPQQLADAMEALATDPARRAAMGEAGQRRGSVAFAAGKMVNATAALYEELAGKCSTEK
jgi:glycosyltransferase involved in cell wall biosynthesis